MSGQAGEDAPRALELGAVLNQVAGYASSEPGRLRVRALEPSRDHEWVTAELERVACLGERMEGDPAWTPPPIPDVSADLSRVAVRGVTLDGEALRRIAVLLSSAQRLHDDLGDAPPALKILSASLFLDTGLERSIAAAVDEDGSIRDSATKELGRIRRELRRGHGRLVKVLESVIAGLPDRWRVSDASVTIRSGRFCIPVRREGKSGVGGIVHDESATGATLFVEPPQAVELMNRYREKELAEAREIQRILRTLADQIRPKAEGLRASFDALIETDSLFARARCALAWEAVLPRLERSNGPLVLVRARHPLLMASDNPVVPFDLELASGERAMVLSGPNAGGKTVLLKTIGLIALLTRCGVMPPVGPGSRIPLFEGVFTDIGDRQSITESLSTFSAHLGSLNRILTSAGPGSLVLIDEMGTGTDPAEGAALAQAGLEALVERRALTIATSHLGALKRLADDGNGVVNASLLFDPDRMEPTFRFLKGRPGRSYGLAMARRLGLPESLLNRAEALVEDSDVRMERLLERLEREEKEAREAREAAERERASLASLREDLERRNEAVAERERTVTAEAAEEARRILLDARSEVERAIADARNSRGRQDEAKEARRRIERAAERHRTTREGHRPTAPDQPAGPGERVRLGKGGAVGTVVELRGEEAVVELEGGLRLRVDPVQLEAAGSGGGPARPRRRSKWSGTAADASTEVDLRGMRVDEVEWTVGRAIDDAVLGDLPSLRIIHGMGTGALRARVGELLALDTRVREFRAGGDGEGGTGVTVVVFK